MRTLTIALMVAFLGLAGSVAGEPEKKKAKEEQEEQKIITNETLKKKYGEPEPAPASPKKDAQKGSAPAKPEKQAPVLSEKDRATRIAALKQEEQRLNKRIRSLKNPFLPKVPLTDEEKKAEAGKGADERVRMLEKRLVAIRDELSKLQPRPGRPS